MALPAIHNSYPRREPTALWKGASSVVMGCTGAISKAFLNMFNDVEVAGLDQFLALLESRKDPFQRQRGLITVSNHISVVDDPLIWGVLPLKMTFNPRNMRWSLGAYDICFKNKLLRTYFSVGQVLPIHRNYYDPYGGLFQPSMTQAIRLLSAYPYKTSASHVTTPEPQPDKVTTQTMLAELRDPFSDGSLIYSTTGRDVHIAPSAFLCNRYSWIHVFPEGQVHQHPDQQMRYFKWGVSRLILEAEPMPDVVPMFIDGTSDVMPEDRATPRWWPRSGNKLKITFGDKVDAEAVFGDLRRRWKALVKKSMEARDKAEAKARKTAEKDGQPAPKKWDVMRVGDLGDDLRDSREAQEIRIEVARRVRDEVLKLRKSLGYPDEMDPKMALAKTWARDPKETKKSHVDGSMERPG